MDCMMMGLLLGMLTAYDHIEQQRITILVLGNDSNPSRLARGMGKLTDAIMVLSVNAKHTQVSMISFPRDRDPRRSSRPNPGG